MTQDSKAEGEHRIEWDYGPAPVIVDEAGNALSLGEAITLINNTAALLRVAVDLLARADSELFGGTNDTREDFLNDYHAALATIYAALPGLRP